MISEPRRHYGDNLKQDLVRRTLEHIDNDDPAEILAILEEGPCGDPLHNLQSRKQ